MTVLCVNSSCIAECDDGFAFENGLHTITASCDLFEGNAIGEFHKCARIGKRASVRSFFNYVVNRKWYFIVKQNDIKTLYRNIV